MSAQRVTRVPQVGTCLLESCQLQLAACVADGNCLQDLICLNTCNGRPDESDCQVSRITGFHALAPQAQPLLAAGAGALISRSTSQLWVQCAASGQECWG